MAGPAEDRLSALPDELLHQILSFLPSTNLVVRTSVLSKRWRNIWVRHQNLRFSMPCPETEDSEETAGEIDSIAESYVFAVDSCLRSFNPPSLDVFRIDLWLPSLASVAESNANSKIAERWLRFAALRSAKKLFVRVRTERGLYGRIPCSIFSCRSLTDLSVSFGTFPDVPCHFLGFRNLTSLAIGRESISNQSVSSLLDGCPMLVYLSLIGCAGLTYVKISARTSPRLKYLLLMSPHGESMDAKIEAPNLRFILFSGSVSRLHWAGSPVLNEAKVENRSQEDFKSFNDWMKRVLAVSNVSLLKVNYWFYQFAIPKNWSSEPLFKNLRELHCNIKWVTGSVICSLACGLRECPLLEKFLIEMDHQVRSVVRDMVQDEIDGDLEGTSDTCEVKLLPLKDALLKCVEDEYELDGWNPFEHPSDSDYYLHHLKIIAVEEFIGSKNEMQLLAFLLAKAIALEQFIIFDFLWRDERDLYEIFAHVPRASAHLQMRLSQLHNVKEKFSKRMFA